MRNQAFRALIALAVVAGSSAAAQDSNISRSVIAPVDEPGAVPLYGAETPGRAGTESWFKWYEASVTSVRNVTRPTLTPVLPDPGKATGAAVIVAPGGAMEFLSIDHEGWKIAHALAERGIAAFVLKYRLKPTPADQGQWFDELQGRMAKLRRRSAAPSAKPSAPVRRMPLELQFPDATADALASIALVRSNSAQWGVDASRVGMIGFSAGAAATLSGVVAAKPGQGPAFFGLIYGPMGRMEVPKDAPPMFAAVAIDDPFFSDTSIIQSWRDAKRPAELHVYQSGGHGFGLGRPGTTNAMWMDEFTTWLSMQGFLTRSPRAQK